MMIFICLLINASTSVVQKHTYMDTVIHTVLWIAEMPSRLVIWYFGHIAHLESKHVLKTIFFLRMWYGYVISSLPVKERPIEESLQ